MFIIFLQQILDSKLLLVIKKMLSVVGQVRINNSLLHKICCEIVVNITLLLKKKKKELEDTLMRKRPLTDDFIIINVLFLSRFSCIKTTISIYMINFIFSIMVSPIEFKPKLHQCRI